MIKLFNLISYFLFLLYSRDHPPIFGRIVSPPGVDDDDVNDDDDDDEATEVQTIIISSHYLFAVTTKSKINNTNYTTSSC